MENVEKIIGEMRRWRLRLTKTRLVLAEVFCRKHTPLSAPQILAELAKKSVEVNKTTVYRELERLERLGIVRGIRLEDRCRYYELASRAHHHHLVCVQCEKVEDVDVSEKELLHEERRVARQKDFAVFRHSLEFFGLCRTCQPRLSTVR